MEDYQVVRMFLMIVEMRKGMKAKPAYLEIGSYWIDPAGNTTVVGLQRTLGHYVDSFAFGSPLEITMQLSSTYPMNGYIRASRSLTLSNATVLRAVVTISTP